MKVQMEKTEPKDDVTATLTITMTKGEWRNWNGRAQRVDRTCPMNDIKKAINDFVETHCRG